MNSCGTLDVEHVHTLSPMNPGFFRASYHTKVVSSVDSAKVAYCMGLVINKPGFSRVPMKTLGSRTSVSYKAELSQDLISLELYAEPHPTASPWRHKHGARTAAFAMQLVLKFHGPGLVDLLQTIKTQSPVCEAICSYFFVYQLFIFPQRLGYVYRILAQHRPLSWAFMYESRPIT